MVSVGDMALPSVWTSICDASDLPAAVFNHFRPVLATSPENAELLRRICASAKAARLDVDHEDEQYHLLEIDFDADKLRCFRPREGEEKADVPASFGRILDLHGRLQLLDAQVDLFHETYVEEEGWLDGTDLEGRGVFSPLRVYADLYIYHPDIKDADGEPALYFLDHETIEDDGPEPAGCSIATLFLKQVAKRLNVGS